LRLCQRCDQPTRCWDFYDDVHFFKCMLPVLRHSSTHNAQPCPRNPLFTCRSLPCRAPGTVAAHRLFSFFQAFPLLALRFLLSLSTKTHATFCFRSDPLLPTAVYWIIWQENERQRLGYRNRTCTNSFGLACLILSTAGHPQEARLGRCAQD